MIAFLGRINPTNPSPLTYGPVYRNVFSQWPVRSQETQTQLVGDVTGDSRRVTDFLISDIHAYEMSRRFPHGSLPDTRHD